MHSIKDYCIVGSKFNHCLWSLPDHEFFLQIQHQRNQLWWFHVDPPYPVHCQAHDLRQYHQHKISPVNIWYWKTLKTTRYFQMNKSRAAWKKSKAETIRMAASYSTSSKSTITLPNQSSASTSRRNETNRKKLIKSNGALFSDSDQENYQPCIRWRPISRP